LFERICILRSCFSVLKNPKTHDPFTELSFAKGLAKVKLGGVVDDR